jgi:serine/threonine protein phosphatase PrpC
MKLTSAGLTDIGPRRVTNNDSYGLYRDLGLYLVADGSGKIALDKTQASQLAVETIANYLDKQQSQEAPSWPFQLVKAKNFRAAHLRNAMRLADRIVFQKGEADFPDDFDLQSFSTYLVALWFTEDGALVSHLGACRAYRIRGTSIEALTEDHSLLQEYKRMKQLSPEEIRDFPHQNVITHSVGTGKETSIEIRKEALQEKDVYLLCTEGLYQTVSSEEMLRIVEGTEDLQDACEKLLASATKKPDCVNCTVVLVRVGA